MRVETKKAFIVIVAIDAAVAVASIFESSAKNAIREYSYKAKNTYAVRNSQEYTI